MTYLVYGSFPLLLQSALCPPPKDTIPNATPSVPDFDEYLLINSGNAKTNDDGGNTLLLLFKLSGIDFVTARHRGYEVSKPVMHCLRAVLLHRFVCFIRSDVELHTTEKKLGDTDGGRLLSKLCCEGHVVSRCVHGDIVAEAFIVLVSMVERLDIAHTNWMTI